MKISFGQKIPTAMCRIMDTKENKMTNALVSELDCHDKEDIQIIKNLGSEWEFSETISLNMQDKYTSNKRGRSNDTKIYILENNNGEILGISCFDDKEKSLEVRFIESKNNNRYKYIGQNMLATMAKQVLNGRQQKMVIKSALADAYDFYEKVCGFKPAEYSDLEMNRFDLIRFIRRTENKTESTIKLTA